MKASPSYIKSLLMPNGAKPAGRKVWSIDLETIWLPFFLATNIMGDTAISHEALGSPLRLGYSTDGSVKFNKNGKPMVKVVKELADTIRIVRENFTATLGSYANGVITTHPDDYKAIVASAKEAGEPITNKDRLAMQEAIQQAIDEAVAKAQAEAEAKGVTPEPALEPALTPVTA